MTKFPSEITAWIRERAIPFDTAEPGNGFADLQPIKQIIGDARIVALGETTHGTHEFFAMKHRILEFLVKEMGFSVFAIERSWVQSNTVNDYVQAGIPARDSNAVPFLGWPFNTSEVIAMIKWMRAHNENPGSAPKVTYQGFDLYGIKPAMNNVINYVWKVARDEVDATRSLYDCLRPYDTMPVEYSRLSPEAKAQCRASIQQAYDNLSRNRADYEDKSSAKEFAFAQQSARVVVQSERAMSIGNDGSALASIEGNNVRDRYMAENVGWILEQAGKDAKIVLWAHNEHVTTRANNTSSGNPPIVRMGQHLREQFGDEYVAFGFDFYGGYFNAYTLNNEVMGALQQQEIKTAPEDSYEYGFASTGIPRMFLDLRGLQPGSPATDWLFGPRRFRAIGAGYDPSQPDVFLYQGSLPKKFDVIVYFENTAAAK